MGTRPSEYRGPRKQRFPEGGFPFTNHFVFVKLGPLQRAKTVQPFGETVNFKDTLITRQFSLSNKRVTDEASQVPRGTVKLMASSEVSKVSKTRGTSSC